MWYRLRLRRIFLILGVAAIEAKDPELPLCPTNMQYFPQNLPMHCRLPGTMPPFPPQVYENSVLGKQPIPIPFPGMPGPMPAPFPGPMPMPIAPMPQAPAQKLPVIVMPFYSPDSSIKNPHASHQPRLPKKNKVRGKKRRPKHYYNSEGESTDTDSSTDDSSNASSEHGWWKPQRESRRSIRHHKSKRKKHQHENILTPILQYVTKDGYVIFEKQLSKGEASNWLAGKKENRNVADVITRKNEDNKDSNEPREDKIATKVLIKDVEEIEVNTDGNNPRLHKKKNFKNKSIRKHIKE